MVALGFRDLGVCMLSMLRIGCRGEVAGQAVAVVETMTEGGSAARRAGGEGGWAMSVARVSTREEEQKLGISMEMVDGGDRGGSSPPKPGRWWRWGCSHRIKRRSSS